jgi:hypothetical protein
MTFKHASALLLFVCVFAICTLAAPSEKGKTSDDKGSDSSTPEKLENIQYTAWEKEKPGTVIVFGGKWLKVFEGQGDALELPVEQTVTQKLLEVKPDRIVLDVTIRTIEDGKNMPMNLRRLSIPKVVDKDELEALGKGFDPELLKKAASDTVTVPAGTFKARVIEAPKRSGGKTIEYKWWLSDEVPGGIVKQEWEGGKGRISLDLQKIERKS